MRTETNAINEQAHNEVKELLDEYVVFPVKKNIENSISAVENCVKDEKENIDSLKSSLSSRLSALERSLNEKIPEQIETLIDELEIDDKIKTSISPVREELDTAKKLLEKLDQSIVDESNTIKDNISIAKTSVSDEADKLKEHSEMLVGDVKTNLTQLLAELQNIHTTLNDCGTYLQEEIPEILEKTNDISQLQAVKWEEAEVLLQKMEVSITSAADRKYKLLMIASVSFHVIELVGIMLLILRLFIF